MSRTSYCEVHNTRQLREAVANCSSSPLLAIDTEFIRTDTFYPRPALIQIYNGEQCFLIDPLAVADFDSLRALLLDESVTKVMHSCGEDLEVFNTLLEVLPRPLIDTQIAAGLAGMEFSMSYQRLVAEILAHEISKEETRSDWLQRPLTDKQMHYAAEDVVWLLDVYHALHQRLQAQGRLDWLLEDCAEILRRADNPVLVEEYYLRIKAARRLDSQGLHILRALCAWREKEARLNNVPRGRVISDANLMQIANVKPLDKPGLSRQTRMSPRSIRRYGELLLDIVSTSILDGEHEHPPLLSRSDSPEARAALKKMKKISTRIAADLGLAPEVLARKKDLEEYYFASDKQQALLGRGWRGAVMGGQLSHIPAANAAIATVDQQQGEQE